MPTINFSNAFNSFEQRVYGKAARDICRELDVADYDASIHVMRAYLPSMTLGFIKQLDPRNYVLFLNEWNHSMENIRTLGHELVHFTQYARGDLQDCADGATFWKGVAYSTVRVQRISDVDAYQNQPWEKEAFAKHDELYQVAFSKLSQSDIQDLFLEDFRKQ